MLFGIEAPWPWREVEIDITTEPAPARNRLESLDEVGLGAMEPGPPNVANMNRIAHVGLVGGVMRNPCDGYISPIACRRQERQGLGVQIGGTGNAF